jgi:hypothetical protein
MSGAAAGLQPTQRGPAPGHPPDWQACKIAQATRPLSADAAVQAGRRLDPWTGQLSLGG